MSFIYVLPIILAGRYYNDDLGRTITGATGWNGDGRPATEQLMRLYSFGRPITDTFPLTLLLGIVIFSYSMTLYMRRYFGEDDQSLGILHVFAGFLLLANPFFINNLSYRFDCLHMLISISVPLLAFAIPCKNEIAGMVFDLICVFLTLCLFQPSVGVYLSLILVEVLICLVFGKPFLKRFLSRCIAAFFAAIIYVTLIVPRFVDKQGWRAEASKLALRPDVLTGNMEKIFVIIKRYLRGLSTPVLIPAVCFVCVSTGVWVFALKKGLQKKNRIIVTAACVLTVLSPAFVFLAGLMPLTVLESGTISDHALVGIGGLIFFVGIGASLSKGWCERALIVLMVPCMLFLYVYIFSYGNAMDSQRRYEEFVAGSIVHDIETTDIERECENIDVIGEMPRSAQLKVMCEKFPQFRSIVPVYIYPEDWIGTALLNHYSDRKLSWQEASETELAVMKRSDPAVRNSLYALYRIENKLILVFN